MSRIFACGERVACRNYTAEGKWKFEIIIEKTGTLHYKILLDDGRSWIRHVNQLRSIGETTPEIDSSENSAFYWNASETQEIEQENAPQQQNIQPPDNDAQMDAPASPQVDPNRKAERAQRTPQQNRRTELSQQTPRRSDRIKKQPGYLASYVKK